MRDRDNVPQVRGVPIRALQYSIEKMRMLERWHICDDDGVMSPWFPTEEQTLSWLQKNRSQRAA